MRYKILGLFAAVALISACETASSGGSSDGSGVKPKPQETKSIVPGSQEDLVVSVGDRVFFEFNMYSLKRDARKTLERQAAWLKANPSVTFAIASTQRATSSGSAISTAPILPCCTRSEGQPTLRLISS